MKQAKRKLIGILLALTAIGVCLTGCTKEEEHPQNTAYQTQASVAVYEAQIEYYEKLVKELQDRLLNEKEANYIESCEFKLKIEDLEDNIKVLANKIGSISVSQDSKFEDKIYENQPQEDHKASNPSEIISKSDYTYIIQNGQVTITSYIGDQSHADIPLLIEGLPVTSIGEEAFKGSSVCSVTLPDSVQTIDWFAFSNCALLSEITIPSSVTCVGYGAFDRCSPSLTVICKKGSYIEAYAMSWGMVVKVT